MIVWFVDKEVFRYESQKGEEWIPFDVARDDKTKILISSKANIEAKSCYYL